MKTHRLPVIAVLVLAAMIITTGVVFALGTGAVVHQGDDGTANGNTAEGDFATVSGGQNNAADGDHSTIGGGGGAVGGNTASGIQSTIGGGVGNSATENSDTVSGGFANVASGGGSTIGGGSHNQASEPAATVGGGGFNTAEGNSATVGGGGSNTASGVASTVPGGNQNSAGGDYSFAAGRRAIANDAGAFVWADSADEDFASTGNDQFLVRAAGGVGIGTTSPTEMLVVGEDVQGPFFDGGNRITIGNSTGVSGLNLGENQNERAFILWANDNDYLQFGTRSGGTTHGNTLVIRSDNVGVNVVNPTESLHVDGNVLADDFLTSSSVRWKDNIETIEGALEKVQGLRGVSYDWKATGEHQIGLIAEEVGEVIPEVVVYEENGVDAKAVDYARLVPVLIEAVKEQQQLMEQKDAQIIAQQQEIAALQEDGRELKARMEALEGAIGIEAGGVQTGLFPFSASMIWMLAGGLGMLVATPGVVLGYRRLRKDD